MEKYMSNTVILDIRLKSQYGASAETEKEFESCVVCGKQTDLRRDIHIDFRAYYVEGCGQLCRECFASLYAADGAGERSRADIRERIPAGRRRIRLFGHVIEFRIEKPAPR